uniref:Carbonic anhydrase n=1 Tax=Geotrypetes seraphini TaxID=260995 RepID=A0A6P8QA42_GEOSA|nr:carbonic anhydrase 9 isoform X8 [Geotrypetes seraphini]
MESSACSYIRTGVLLLVTLGRSEDAHNEHTHSPHRAKVPSKENEKSAAVLQQKGYRNGRGSPGHSHWNYADQMAWTSDFHSCGGASQSPINIQLSETIFDPSLRPFLLSGFDVPEDEKLKLKNNGHTVVLDLPDNLLIHNGLPQEYRAAQLHFHWGSRGAPGSEHSVDGKRYSGEIHVVHYSTEYSTIQEAMTQPGGLAVLGAFLEAGSEENPTYEHFLTYLPQVSNEGQDTEVPGFNISGLLPGRMERYYRYNGSLTTPPCFQSVNWTIFNDTIKLSERQISMLEDTLHRDDEEILQLNFRNAQHMHGRIILANFRTSPVSGRRDPPADADGEGGTGVVSQPKNISPDNGVIENQRAPTLGTGDMLAIIFGVLFAFTALSFLIYVRKHRNRSRRLNTENKPNVIYKAATTEENIA